MVDPATARKKSNVDQYVKRIAREEYGRNKQGPVRDAEYLYDQGIVVTRINRDRYELQHPDTNYGIRTTGLRESRQLIRDLEEVKNLLEDTRRKRWRKQNYRAVVNIFREEWKRK